MSFIGNLVGDVIGGITGTKQAAKGAQKAAQIQSQAAQAGITEQQRQFDLTRSDLQPWTTAGQSALSAQMGLMGLNGTTAQQSAIDALLNGPEYSSLLRQGEEGILQNASATGGLRGGNVQNSLAHFRSDLLSQLISERYSQLGGISSAGAQVGTSVGAFGANNAMTIAQLLGQQGAAKAGGVIAKYSVPSQTFKQSMEIAAMIAGAGGFGGGGGGGLRPGDVSGMMANNPGAF